MRVEDTPDGQVRDFSALEPLWELWEDGTVAGLRHRLVNRVKHRHRFPESVADEIVEEAFDQAVRALSKGQRIVNLGAWFYKVVDRCASKRIGESRVLAHNGKDIARAFQSVPVTPREMLENEHRKQVLRDLALSHAASLAPHVGTGQVRDVFDVFLDAARNDLVDGVPAMISETLDIPLPQVRALIDRALRRLRKAAAAQGISLDLQYHDQNQVQWSEPT